MVHIIANGWGHFGERSLLRGGDCAVPEAPMKKDETPRAWGELFESDFGIYFTTLKVTL